MVNLIELTTDEKIAYVLEKFQSLPFKKILEKLESLGIKISHQTLSDHLTEPKYNKGLFKKLNPENRKSPYILDVNGIELYNKVIENEKNSRFEIGNERKNEYRDNIKKFFKNHNISDDDLKFVYYRLYNCLNYDSVQSIIPFNLHGLLILYITKKHPKIIFEKKK